jgi:ankyrin repeat protein
MNGRSFWRVVFVAGFVVSASAQTPDAAKKKLDDMKIPFTEAAFLENVSLGEASVVKLFLEAGMSANVKAEHDMTPLQFAASQGSDAVVQLLLEAKADPNAKDVVGGTALDRAALNGHPQLISLLVRGGASVNVATPDGETILHKFIRNPSPEFDPAPSTEWVKIVQALIAAKADPNAADSKGRTPLMMAASGPMSPMKPTEQQDAVYADIVKALIAGGANANAQDKAGKGTALMIAASNGFAQTVAALLAGGADVALKATNGRSALDFAKDHPAVQTFLRAAGAK